MTEAAAPAAEAPKQSGRVFLVVIDNSPELRVAMRYACRRANRTGGRVALLHVIDDEDFRQFLGVSELMRQESRQEAEALVQKTAARCRRFPAPCRCSICARATGATSC